MKTQRVEIILINYTDLLWFEFMHVSFLVNELIILKTTDSQHPHNIEYLDLETNKKQANNNKKTQHQEMPQLGSPPKIITEATLCETEKQSVQKRKKIKNDRKRWVMK